MTTFGSASETHKYFKCIYSSERLNHPTLQAPGAPRQPIQNTCFLWWWLDFHGPWIFVAEIQTFATVPEVPALSSLDVCSEQQYEEVRALLFQQFQISLAQAEGDWEAFALNNQLLHGSLCAMHFENSQVRAAINNFLQDFDESRDTFPLEAHMAELQLYEVLQLFA